MEKTAPRECQTQCSPGSEDFTELLCLASLAGFRKGRSGAGLLCGMNIPVAGPGN